MQRRPSGYFQLRPQDADRALESARVGILVGITVIVIEQPLDQPELGTLVACQHRQRPSGSSTTAVVTRIESGKPFVPTATWRLVLARSCRRHHFASAPCLCSSPDGYRRYPRSSWFPERRARAQLLPVFFIPAPAGLVLSPRLRSVGRSNGAPYCPARNPSQSRASSLPSAGIDSRK